MKSKNKRFEKPKSDASAFSFSSETLEVEIEKLSFGGDGIARKDGLVYFVPLSAPGDILKVQTTEKKKNFARAEIIEILKPGPSRIAAPCPYFGRCGGCAWQHITYEEQLRQKQLIIQEQLSHHLSSKTEILPIIGSPKSFRYRNRIQLKFDGKNLGFHARQSHQIVDIDDCLITEEIVAAEIPKLKAELKGREAIPKIEVLQTPQGLVQRSFEGSPYEGVAFAQVNTAQNENLIQTVLKWMEPLEPKMLFDLYAGSGNFSFPLLKKFPKSSMTSVELNEKSVQAANQYLREQNLSPAKIRFYLSDVELFLKRQVLDPEAVMLLDPPRTGCSENTIRYLAVQPLKRIFYISCNPAALARDLGRFKSLGSWTPVRIQPFDMFPQTDHVETLVELAVDSR
jgi:23S rRNA (uracil1939-C5)-methyltransferase